MEGAPFDFRFAENATRDVQFTIGRERAIQACATLAILLADPHASEE
jgi:hypothetical protein